jgi:DNA-binding MarR family transcriptional regulator
MDQVTRFENSMMNLHHAFRLHQSFIRDRYGVSSLEMELIQFVQNNGPQKMKAVSEHFRIKLSTLTSIIDKAEENRILKRVNSKEDRRVVFLDVTPKGVKVYDEYSAFLREAAGRILGEFSQESFSEFHKGLEAFASIRLD